MKNCKFCKIIEFDGYQVLVVKTYNEKGDYAIKIMTQIDDGCVQPEITVTFKTEKSRDAEFEAYGKDKALMFVDEMGKFINA